MCGSAIKLTEVASIFCEDGMGINSFGGPSQVGQALGNYVWRWVPHPHMYTPTLWEQGTVIRMSGSTLELTEVASIISEVDVWIISFEVPHKLTRHLRTTRGVGFPILTCKHLPCGNRELSSECVDLL